MVDELEGVAQLVPVSIKEELVHGILASEVVENGAELARRASLRVLLQGLVTTELPPVLLGRVGMEKEELCGGKNILAAVTEIRHCGWEVATGRLLGPPKVIIRLLFEPGGWG